jgi:LPXTG-motif cell wall-anchored protein
MKGWKKMRIILSILAVLLMLVGVVWVLQGIGVIGGSVMTGQSQWTIIGGVSFIVGAGLLVFANRKKSSTMNMQK